MQASDIMGCYVVIDTGTIEGAETSADLEVRRIGEVDVTLVHHPKPTSPTAMNAALKLLSQADPDADTRPAPTHILAVSKEVDSAPEDIERLLEVRRNTQGLLVAGSRLSTPNDPELDAILQLYYNDPDALAYQVPWNTIPLWNYDYFKRYVGKFDEITEWDGESTVDTERGTQRLQGMEDGLAVAKAIASGLRFALLPDTIPWM